MQNKHFTKCNFGTNTFCRLPNMQWVEKLRYYGRKVVLPSDAIKNFCFQKVTENNFRLIVDFGAGTLYWSKWLAKTYKCKVAAVDTLYSDEDCSGVSEPLDNTSRIILSNSIYKTLDENQDIDMVWMCDVIHHLDPNLWSEVLTKITGRTNWIIIKDIDATKKIGNFANKMHDLIINHERIYNVFPQTIMEFLHNKNYKTFFVEIPKLWYPHFLIIAHRENI